MRKAICILFLLVLPSLVFAQEILTIESTITGSQEQPRVITIVPWQDPKPPQYFGEDIKGLNQQKKQFDALERRSFNSEYQYISTLENNTDN